MKKILIYLLSALFVAGLTVSASGEDNADVNVYGQLRLSVDNNSDDFGSGKKGTSIKSNSSRLGVKGTIKSVIEGTTIFYLAEMKYGAADEKSTEIEWREGYAGIKGKWGKFRLGRLSMKYKSTLTKIDPWNDNVAQSRGFGGCQGSSAFHSSYVNNAADYVSPKYEGFYGSVWISSQFEGEENEFHNAGPCNKYLGGNAMGISAHFDKGAIFLAADIMDIDADTVTSVNMDMGSGWQVAGRYKTNIGSIAVFYEDLEDLGLGTNIYVNGIYNIEKLRLIATYGMNRDATQYGLKELNTWSIGGKYALGKGTEVFGVYNSRDDGTNTFNSISSGINIKFGY